MKRIFTLVCVAALALSASAQRKASTEASKAVGKPTDAELMMSERFGNDPAGSERGGNIVFQEDFSNGFAGSNGIGPMTFEDTGGNDADIWMMATSTGADPSPSGEWDTGIPALASTTKSNGWVIFDCDLYNSTLTDYVDVYGWLSTPSIDCSTLESVVVEYQHYFRYCCFSPSPLTLQVSNDGGNTWAVFPAQGGYNATGDLSANPLKTVIDVSCAAAGYSDVKFRWGYNIDASGGMADDGYSHYFWGIDDIKIFENTLQNDIEVVQTTNGDIFNIWEYRSTPLAQRVLASDGGLLAGVIFRNNGTSDEPNTTIRVDILDSDNTVLSTTTTEPFTLPSFANTEECPSFILDTLYIETGWEPSAIGLYTVRATITTGGVDEVPDNNSSDRVIEYTDCDYAHEDSNELDLNIGPRESEDNPDEFDPTGYGNFFTVPNQGSTAYGISVQFGSNCDVGAEFTAVLFQTNGDLNGAGEVLASEDYITTEGQLNDEYHYYAFDDDVSLQNDEVYFTAIMNENPSELRLSVSAQSDSDSDNSTSLYERAGSGDMVWFGAQTWSPAVRLILCQQVGVEEIVNDELLTFFQISPNPASDVTRINYELAASAPVAYEVRDMMGRLVEVKNLGRQQPGKNTFTINVSAYAAGTYNVGLVVDGARMFSKKLNVTK